MKICLLGQEVWTGWVHLYEWPPFVGEGPFYMAPWDDGATWGHQVGVFLLAFLKASRQLASWPIVTLQFGPISWSVRSCHSPVIGVRSLSPASLSRAGWHCHFTAYLGCALRIVGGGLLVQVSSPKFSPGQTSCHLICLDQGLSIRRAVVSGVVEGSRVAEGHRLFYYLPWLLLRIIGRGFLVCGSAHQILRSTDSLAPDRPFWMDGRSPRLSELI